MKRLITGMLVCVAFHSTTFASVESKTWTASDKAVQFVADTIVIGMLASPHGTGWRIWKVSKTVC